MLLLQGQSEPIDYTAQDLQQLGHAVVPLGFVDEPIEDVVDLFPNVGSEPQ